MSKDLQCTYNNQNFNNIILIDQFSKLKKAQFCNQNAFIWFYSLERIDNCNCFNQTNTSSSKTISIINNFV